MLFTQALQLTGAPTSAAFPQLQHPISWGSNVNQQWYSSIHQHSSTSSHSKHTYAYHVQVPTALMQSFYTLDKPGLRAYIFTSKQFHQSWHIQWQSATWTMTWHVPQWPPNQLLVQVCPSQALYTAKTPMWRPLAKWQWAMTPIYQTFSQPNCEQSNPTGDSLVSTTANLRHSQTPGQPPWSKYMHATSQSEWDP